MAEVRLLGVVEMRAAGQPLDLGPPKQRAVFAALVVDAGRPVRVETLVDRVWGDTPPAEARNSLYAHIMRIRRLLAQVAAADGSQVRLDRRAGGYQLDIDRDQVDLHRFHRLVAEARDGGYPDAQRARLLRQALDLWQGTPVADLPGEWFARQRDSWRRHWLDAMVAWARAELRSGHHDAVVGQLPDVVASHPLVEPLAALLIQALHAAGRGAEALDQFGAVRQHLVDELGADPGPELQAAHRAVLRGEPATPANEPPNPAAHEPPGPPAHEPPGPTTAHMPAGPAAANETAAVPAPDRQPSTGPSPAGEPTGPSPAGEPAGPVPDHDPSAGAADRQSAVPVRPAQLPADVPAFAGRAEPLGRLDGLLGATAAQTPTAVTISAVSGMAGIGKTALAVHWAHRVADRFPDGQLYVNLRGFDPGSAPVPPADAVRGFLEAFAVPPHRVPAGLDAQSTLYRSTLAGKRVLVLLDNARDAEQVRPLLPGTSGCLALVTSRSQLTSLVAAEGAQPIVLDVLPVAEARDLLARRLGADRVAAEPGAVDQIIAACARLPLALSIAAARAQQTGFPLAEIAAELHTAGQRLDALDAGDAASQVRTVFSWSYATITPPAARLFRLLGLHPGPQLGVAAAASLAGLPVGRVRPLLTELARAHLVAEQSTGRFALHDLLRSYATELAKDLDTRAERHAAQHRMFDHYLHTGYAADRLIHPERDPVPLPEPHAGAVPTDFAGPDQALRWFDTERVVLLGMVEQAAAAGFDRHTWQLAWTLTDSLQRHGHWHDQLHVQRAALAAGQRLADRTVQVHAHRDLARGYLHLGKHGDALGHIRAALDLVHAIDDPTSHAITHLTCSKVMESSGDVREALHHARRALTLFGEAGNRHGQANALNSVGWLYGILADHERALDHCLRALALHEQLGNRIGAALTWDSVGYVRHQLGRYREAADDYRQALDLLRTLGDRYNEAVVLDHLGDTHAATGDQDAARTCWRQALIILDELGHHDADAVRTKVDTR